jgi:dTDP-4-amino-4,6-dideoxygalactose transaminase
MANRDRIYLSPPHMSGQEEKFVSEAFATNWIAPIGPHVTAFEKELQEYLGIDHCAALSSGTAAIHLSLIILGIEKGDEVICSSFTFSASCNPIVYQGAIPVFVDSEPDTWNMDPVLLEEAIADRIRKTSKVPKAVIIVHLYGMPAKMKEIVEVCQRYGIPIIEDAAEALGSTYRGQKLGTFGDFGILSFNGNKIITTSGGGALVSRNGKWIEKARFLATQARDQAPHYEHSHIGYNYRLSNVCAGIGRGQLMAIGQKVAKRRENFDYYAKQFSSQKGISFQPEMEGSYSNRWLTCILIDKEPVTREILRIKLEEENIETRPLWKPMHLQPVFKDAPAYVRSVSQSLFDKGLCLPSGSSLMMVQLDMVKNLIFNQLG